MMNLFIEHIVMTPKSKTANSTTLIIERQAIDPPKDIENESNVHIAGGDHKGIVINKRASTGASIEIWASDRRRDLIFNLKFSIPVTNGVADPAQLCLEFRVFLVSAQTGNHTQESRTLQFWFAKSLPSSDQPSIAQEFFRELVSPKEFPRGDYKSI